MLHRTQVVQVVPVFQEFIARYPGISELARANQQEIQSSLSSLGLHWRINLIHGMAHQIAKRFEMQIPREKADLLSLPGVSEYIAGAVRCFALDPLSAKLVRVVRVVRTSVRRDCQKNKRGLHPCSLTRMSEWRRRRNEDPRTRGTLGPGRDCHTCGKHRRFAMTAGGVEDPRSGAESVPTWNMGMRRERICAHAEHGR
jgi:hypothetical protein